MRIKSILLTALLGIVYAVTAQAAFHDEGDVVWDDKTGLMWQQATASTTTSFGFKWGGGAADDGVCVPGGDADDQVDALCYCEQLNLAGNGDWLLPDRNELQSLVDYTQQPVTIDPIFSDTNASYYWSSTTGSQWVDGMGFIYDTAVAINFARGFALPAIPKAGRRNVRCVGDRIFRITSQAVGPGTIVTTDLEENLYGNTVAYTITADAGENILDVVVDGTSVGPVANYTFPATTAGAHSITASFTTAQTISVTNGAGCTIDPDGAPSGQVLVAEGSDQAFTMGTNDHFTLTDVLVDAVTQVPIVNPYTFYNVIADHTIETVCTEDPKYTLTVTLAGTGKGEVTSNPTGIDCDTEGGCTNNFYDGTDVVLTATADNAGSAFAGWSGGGCTGTGTCTVTMNQDVNVTATFKEEGTIFLYMPAILNGAIY